MPNLDRGPKIARRQLHAARIVVDALFWPALLLVVWGELGPPSPIEGAVNDKVLHFTAYFGLAAMAAAGLKTRRSALAAVVVLILFGGILEIIQGFVGRDMSIFDELTNAAGAIIGGFLARAAIEPLRRRFARD